MTLILQPVNEKKGKVGKLPSASCLIRHLLVDDRIHIAGVHGHDDLNPVRTPGAFQFNGFAFHWFEDARYYRSIGAGDPDIDLAYPAHTFATVKCCDDCRGIGAGFLNGK